MTANVDYAALARTFQTVLPRDRIVTDELRTLSYGTDASFYRLTPRIVAIVESEAETIGVMKACGASAAPYTFRAAGTSLSGQAVTDSVLIMLGDDGRARAFRRMARRLPCNPP